MVLACDHVLVANDVLTRDWVVQATHAASRKKGREHSSSDIDNRNEIQALEKNVRTCV